MRRARKKAMNEIDENRKNENNFLDCFLVLEELDDPRATKFFLSKLSFITV